MRPYRGPSNMAEGQGRLTRGEFRNSLGHSRGSLFELETQIEIATRLQFIPKDDALRLFDRSAEITRMLNALITSMSRDKK